MSGALLGLLGVGGLLVASKMRETSAQSAPSPMDGTDAGQRPEVGTGELGTLIKTAGSEPHKTPIAGGAAVVVDTPGLAASENIRHDGHGVTSTGSTSAAPPPERGAGILPIAPVMEPVHTPVAPLSATENAATPPHVMPTGPAPHAPVPTAVPPAGPTSIIPAYGVTGPRSYATTYFKSGAARSSGQMW